MANTYHKLFCKDNKENFKNALLTKTRANSDMNFLDMYENLYDIAQTLDKDKKDNAIDTNSLLKYYIINQLIEKNLSVGENKDNSFLVPTANPEIKFNCLNNEYCKINENKKNNKEKIITVNNDGSYITIETKNNSFFKIKKFYDKNQELLKIQMINNENVIQSNKIIIAEFLGLKKEYVQKYKYSGFSGNSKDLIASLLNKISSPLESGCYMDNLCNIFVWSKPEKAFVRCNNSISNSPFLTDYEFINNIVVKKEYTGIK